MCPSRRVAEPHPAFSLSNFKRLWIEPNTQEETSPFFLSAHHVQKARRSYQRKKKTILYCLQTAPLRTAGLHEVYTKPVQQHGAQRQSACPWLWGRSRAGARRQLLLLPGHRFNPYLPGDRASPARSPSGAFPNELIPGVGFQFPHHRIHPPASPFSSVPAREEDPTPRTGRAGVYTEFVGTGARRGWRLARQQDADGDTALNGTFIRERVAENRTLCSSTRPAVFTKSFFTGPVLSRELTAKVLRLLPSFETKLFGSQEQIASPMASVPHLQTGTGTSASRIRH